MTREEAIKILEAEKKFLFHGSLADKHYEPAFDMAIEALQTDIVKCEECKHSYESPSDHTYTGYDLACGLNDEPVVDDFFCKSGERRTPCD